MSYAFIIVYIKHLNLLIQVHFKTTFIIIGGEKHTGSKLANSETEHCICNENSFRESVRGGTDDELAIRKTSLKLLNISVISKATTGGTILSF